MSRGRNNKSGRPVARAAAKYTIYNVSEPAELMDFLMQKMAGISRSKVKTMLTNRVILVDNTITTQYNFALTPGMKVQVSKAKNNREFKNPMLKLVYEDAYIIVVEKKEGLLSVIESCDEEDISTMDVAVTAFREDGAWKLHLDDAFINAFMGNINAEEYSEEVQERIEELEWQQEEKIDDWADKLADRVESWAERW